MTTTIWSHDLERSWDHNELPEMFDEGTINPALPMDDRDEDEPEFWVDEELSSTNTNYGGGDPADDF